MAKIYQRFSAKRNPGSWYIRFRSGPGTRHSHVEFLHPAENWVLGSRMIGGVKYRQPSKHDINVDIVAVEVPCTVEEFFAHAEKFIGCGYDFGWASSWIMPFRADSTKRFGCSEFVAQMLRDMGCAKVKDTGGWLTPRDLWLFLKNEEV